jgi:DNA-binding GntR family transcriptional regulator
MLVWHAVQEFLMLRPSTAVPPAPLWNHIAPIAGHTRSAGECALMKLRADILSGHLVPGTKIVIEDLIDAYQIGVTPLRDALAQLVGSGLVCRRAQRGFQVAPVSRDDLHAVAKSRKLIELAAFELSLQNVDDVWKMRATAAHMAFCDASRGVGDNRPISDEWEQRHRAFHFALLSGCGSPTLYSLCANLHDQFDRYRRLALPTLSFMSGVDQDHEVLLEAALDGRIAEALAVLGQHIDDTYTVIAQCFGAAQH